ncbi:hypothetical protein AB0B30_19425 [Streptomyces narbonensis]|uniref:hypothetical protein n=1 Tax=Streptomyces narbonensis TaxID=67333 RepID=UPI003405F4C0
MRRIALLLERRGAAPYRARAFHTAADAVSDLSPGPVDAARVGRLRGVSAVTAEVISQAALRRADRRPTPPRRPRSRRRPAPGSRPRHSAPARLASGRMVGSTLGPGKECGHCRRSTSIEAYRNSPDAASPP